MERDHPMRLIGRVREKWKNRGAENKSSYSSLRCIIKFSPPFLICPFGSRRPRLLPRGGAGELGRSRIDSILFNFLRRVSSPATFSDPRFRILEGDAIIKDGGGVWRGRYSLFSLFSTASWLFHPPTQITCYLKINWDIKFLFNYNLWALCYITHLIKMNKIRSINSFI